MGAEWTQAPSVWICCRLTRLGLVWLPSLTRPPPLPPLSAFLPLHPSVHVPAGQGRVLLGARGRPRQVSRGQHSQHAKRGQRRQRRRKNAHRLRAQPARHDAVDGRARRRRSLLLIQPLPLQACAQPPLSRRAHEHCAKNVVRAFCLLLFCDAARRPWCDVATGVYRWPLTLRWSPSAVL